MKRYKHILLAVELDSAADSRVISKASELRDHYQAQLDLLHVVEHLSNYGAAYGVAAGVDIEEILVKEAERTTRKVGEKLNIPPDCCLVKVGPTTHTIIEEAKKRGVDLIILGSHGRHGVRLLLGSTANGVIHGAHCDVLAVRLKE